MEKTIKNFSVRMTAGFICIVFVSGCSTMFGRQHDEEMVTFDSNVQDVEVLCSGKRVSTPGSLPLRQSKNHSCTAQKEGYEKKVFMIRSGVSGSGFAHSTALNTAILGWWTLGIGTAIGWLVDWPSGAMKNLKEDSLYLEMKPSQPKMAAQMVTEKTEDIAKTIATIPSSIVNTSTQAVLDTMSDGAEKTGMSTPVDASVKANPKQKTV